MTITRSPEFRLEDPLSPFLSLIGHTPMISLCFRPEGVAVYAK